MEKEMVQQIMRAPHQVGFRKVPVPAVLPGQVKVRIQMIGICGSDIHVFHGTHPLLLILLHKDMRFQEKLLRLEKM